MEEIYQDKLLGKIIVLIKKTCENDIRIIFDDADICLETDLKLDLNMDSFALVVLQINIEECFDIQFDPLQDDFDEIFHKVKDVYMYVQKKLESRQSW